jgi:GH25 family lysozyme M1 (1,4-beta-N-acetylmuramidase)
VRTSQATKRIALTALAVAALAAPQASAERTPGIDVSRFQGRINWELVAADGVEFAFVQASRGSGNDCTVAADRCGPDEFYDRNYTRARKAGIRIGPYHRTFTGGRGPKSVRADAREEANVFLAEVGKDYSSNDLPPVLDVESPFNDLSGALLRRWIRNWLVKVEKELGVRPLIYTNVSSWSATGNTTRFAQQGYRLWVANFDVPRPQVPAENWAGFGWSIWQYTSTGSVSGIAGDVDRNHARVPLDDLDVAGPGDPPDEPEPVGARGAYGGAKTVWLCEPGVEPNPCRESLETTVTSESGETRVENPGLAKRPKIDCFYVYPTVSEDPGTNSDLSIDPEHVAIARYQAARFSHRCRVWAPMYRQATLASIAAGSNEARAEALRVAYDDIRAAWRDYLATHNDGRGVVLIGHSQGTMMLRQLIREQVDPKRSVRKRLVSAILLGANVTVREGQAAGGDFEHVPACKRPRQLGCAIAYSAFNETPPENSRFGRPIENAASIAFGLPTGEGYEVLCTNPAALGGGRAPLTTLLRSEPYPGVIGALLVYMYGGTQPSAPTPWLVPRDHYTGACAEEAGANFLSIEPVGDARRMNPSPDASWGLHLADVNIALGELVEIVHRQKRVYVKASRDRTRGLDG